MVMAEGNRLIAHDVDLIDVGRAGPQISRPSDPRKNKHATKDGGLRERVHAGMKDLRHDYATSRHEARWRTNRSGPDTVPTSYLTAQSGTRPMRPFAAAATSRPPQSKF